MRPNNSCCRGPLVSVEGISGVGKTCLTRMLAANLAKQEAAPVVTESFSARKQPGRRDLGRDLLRVLVSASDGGRFLRSGDPAADTLLLLAIKMHDYETNLPQLASGHVVIEGRSLPSQLAVRQRDRRDLARRQDAAVIHHDHPLGTFGPRGDPVDH